MGSVPFLAHKKRTKPSSRGISGGLWAPGKLSAGVSCERQYRGKSSLSTSGVTGRQPQNGTFFRRWFS